MYSYINQCFYRCAVDVSNFIIKQDVESLNWVELADVYRRAPLGERMPDQLKRAFEASYFTAVVFREGKIIGAGRVLSDGEYYANIYDVVVLPEYQGQGVGKAIMKELQCRIGDLFVLLTTTLGKEPFYHKLGFRKHKTAMAIYPQSKKENARKYLKD